MGHLKHRYRSMKSMKTAAAAAQIREDDLKDTELGLKFEQ